MELPRWMEQPQTGLDAADGIRITQALDLLDGISFDHQTDALRVLAGRYRDWLVRMGKEDEARRQRPAAGGGA